MQQGADKRLVKENRELMRMFYDCGKYYPDSAGVPGTSIRNLSESLIDRFFENQFCKRKEDFNIPTEVLYENMCFLDEEGQAILALHRNYTDKHFFYTERGFYYTENT